MFDLTLQGIEGMSAAASVLSRPADEFGNDVRTFVIYYYTWIPRHMHLLLTAYPIFEFMEYTFFRPENDRQNHSLLGYVCLLAQATRV